MKVKVMMKKLLATALAAACIITSMPQNILAEEAVTEDYVIEEETDAVEADASIAEEAEAVTEEVVAEAVDVDEAATDEVEALEAGPETADWHSPVAYTVGKKASGMVYDQNNNTAEGRKAGLYYDKRFYTFTTQEDGIYAFNATAPDNKIEFYLTPDIDRCLNWSNGKKYVFGTADPDIKDKELYLLKDMTLFIVVDGYCGNDMDKSYEFTLSVKKKVKIYDKEHPDTISLSSAKTTTGTIERNFAYYNIQFNDNENLSAHENYYQFEVTEAGRLNMEFTADDNVSYVILNAPHWGSLENGVKVEWNPGTNGSEVKNYKGYADLKKGTYNLKVYSTSSSDGSSDYTLKTEFKPIKPDKSAKNAQLICDDVLGGSRNDEDSAKKIETDIKYYAQSSEDSRTKTDYYKLTLASPTKLFLSVSSTEIDSIEFFMKDGYGDGATYLSFENFTDYYATPEKPIDGRQLEAKYRSYTTSFPAGTYYVGFKKYTTGYYTFELSTGAKVQPKSLKLNKTSTVLGLKGEETITATVLPENAENKSVVWKIEDHPELVEWKDNGDGTCTIKGKADGFATLIATCANPAVKPVECKIQVLDVELTQKHLEGLPMITKQKVDLNGAGYFNEPLGKDITFEVNPKAAGTVDKSGIFTAKKAFDTVTVSKKIKVGKLSVSTDSVTFKIEAPIYLKPDAKGKANSLKSVSSIKKGDVIDLNEYIGLPTIDKKPSYYETNDKKGNFTMDQATGKLTVNNTGNCKVTAYYFSETVDLNDPVAIKAAKKAAGSIAFSVKSTLPLMKTALKFTVPKKAKPFNVAVTKVDKTITLDSAAWKIRKCDSEGTIIEGAVPETYATFTPVVKGRATSYLQGQLSVGDEVQSGDMIAVTVTVQDVEYTSIVTVIKK